MSALCKIAIIRSAVGNLCKLCSPECSAQNEALLNLQILKTENGTLKECSEADDRVLHVAINQPSLLFLPQCVENVAMAIGYWNMRMLVWGNRGL